MSNGICDSLGKWGFPGAPSCPWEWGSPSQMVWGALTGPSTIEEENAEPLSPGPTGSGPWKYWAKGEASQFIFSQVCNIFLWILKNYIPIGIYLEHFYKSLNEYEKSDLQSLHYTETTTINVLIYFSLDFSMWFSL